MARRTVTPAKGKDFLQGVKFSDSGWMLLSGTSGWSGSGGEPQTTPISTDDENYLLPGDTPPPTRTTPIVVLEPTLDVFQALQDALQTGEPIEYVCERKNEIYILSDLPPGAKVTVPAAAVDPKVGRGWKLLGFDGDDTPDWEDDSRLRRGMVIEITGQAEPLTIQHIGKGNGTGSKVYVSGDAPTVAVAATYKVKIAFRQLGPILCSVVASPSQTDEASADTQHSGTLSLAPTGTIPKWKNITDGQRLLNF